jgi:HlyD family secretion protein
MKKIFNWLKKHKIISGILIAVILLIVYFSYQKFRPKSPQELYDLAPAKISSLTQTVSASGRIKSQTQIDLKFQTSGQLAWVGVKEGDRVKKWQALASLDTRELQMNLKKYLLDFSSERRSFDEDLQVTYRDKALTDTISRILATNQADLDSAVVDVQIKDLAVKLATIVSPIDGIVTNVEIPVPGVNVIYTTSNFTVADPDQLYFEAEIDETDIGKIQLGQAGKLVLDAYPNDPLDLTVDSIDFNSSTDAAGSTIYLIKFNVSNDPENPLYRLGMNGEITITTAQKDDILTVPLEAVSANQVQLVDGKKVAKSDVVTGIESDTDVEITSGLKADQLVVIGNKSK